MTLIWRGAFKQIETNRICHIGRIEIHHILDPMARNMVEKVIRQIAVRINDADTPSGLDVLKNQIAEQGRFT